MERTIQFYDRVLSLAKHLQATGRHTKAGETFRKLLALKQLPSNIAEEAQGRLAEMNLQQGRLASARRHLSAALGYQPNHSHYHYLMGVAAERDDEDRALRHYQRSIQLHPNQPDYLCDFGLLAVHMGYVKKGLHCLRRAVELAPDDVDVLERVTEGLRLADCVDEAKEYLRNALFRTGGDTRIRRLQDNLAFHAVCDEPESAETSNEPGQEEPVVLQFRNDVQKTAKRKKAGWRFDGPSAPSKPHVRFQKDDHRPAS